uniref:DUF4190 domain-containing protein n=1 Tax=Paractinoplanes polyasparticus TaxID=2856853 RepID=UPI001C84A6CA|nr:DUF4190 domain-containing protein [Actinoplanes polyasparticus]
MTTPPPYYGPPGGEPGGVPAAPQNTQGLVGMILGIVSIPLVCCFYLGIPLGIAAAIVSYLGLQKANAGRATNRSQAMAGLITGAVGAVLGIALLIWALTAGQNINWEDITNNSGN